MLSPTRVLRLILPRGRFGDFVFHLYSFVRHHGRLPRAGMRFNDVLFRIKTSKEIVDPLRVFVSDKELVKLYVAALVGKKHVVPTLNVIRSVNELASYDFPDSCCVKATHASGKVFIRADGEPIPFPILKNWLQENYYSVTRERNYKDLLPKLIVEPLIFGESEIIDFKFFVFRGKVKLIQVDFERFTRHSRQFFDPEWTSLDFSIKYPRSEKTMGKPDNLGEMIRVAEKLAGGFTFIRVDLYSNGTECLVGELTNCHGSATERFIPLRAEELASQTLFD